MTRLLCFIICSVMSVSAAGVQSKLDTLKACLENSGLGQTSGFRMRQTLMRDGQKVKTVQAECFLANKGEKLMVKFEDPPDMAEVKLLFREWGKQLWTYFPSTNRVRKMVGAATSQSIGSAGFSYNDLIPFLNDTSYDFKVLDNRIISNRDHYVLKASYDRKQSSPYRYSELFIDVADCTLKEANLYGDNGRLLKIISFTGYKTVKGRNVPSKIHVSELDSGEEADINLLAIDFDRKYNSSFFTELGLKQ